MSSVGAVTGTAAGTSNPVLHNELVYMHTSSLYLYLAGVVFLFFSKVGLQPL